MDEKENLLFGRKEMVGSVDSEKTPSRQEILKLLAEKFSVPESHVKIKKIHGNFGAKTFMIEANIYSSDKDKQEIEIKKKKEKAKNS